jgi:hypothetical protein
MYNHREFSRITTMSRLEARTRAYRAQCSVDDEASLRRFRQIWEPRAEEKLLDGLPSCPFLGLLDDEGRVGCLVHPLQNGGVDGRDCGVYDRETCDSYLCAAHDLLSTSEKRLILSAVDDSYLYGLVLTNIRFVKELLERCAALNGTYPRGERLYTSRALEAARGCFELLSDWPYGAKDGVFGQIVAGKGLETARRVGPSLALGVEPDQWEVLLTCLGTEVHSTQALEEARHIIAERVGALAAALN